jgi:class 3 adenylate cyclase
MGAGARFCGECGAASRTVEPTTADARPGAGSPAPVAERRLVSILFADLVGFTTFAEDRDAEEVRDTQTTYFDLASSVITR